METGLVGMLAKVGKEAFVLVGSLFGQSTTKEGVAFRQIGHGCCLADLTGHGWRTWSESIDRGRSGSFTLRDLGDVGGKQVRI